LLRIAVLISGGGSNLQSIIDSVEKSELQCKIEIVISDRDNATGIERAKKHGISTLILDRKTYGESLSDNVLEAVNDKVDLIVLAGFLSILKGKVLDAFNKRIINIHPSLIPSFCGNGMYGIKVHEKALSSGVKVSGCTVHYVDSGTDTGPIILQRVVPVYFEDTSVTLQKRVLVEEHKALPEAIDLISKGRISIIDGKVKIADL
jgi:phosphoribosylglycinamide formyltransferase-1